MLEFERPLKELEQRLDGLKALPLAHEAEIAEEIAYLEGQLEKLRRRTYAKLSAWHKVQVARHPDRPRSMDYFRLCLTGFVPLHGDRLYRDDPAIVGGFAELEGRKLMAIGEQKGKTTKENVARNFGMPHPEGYRKALRLMELAGRFGLPVLCLIDTPGAYPGVGAEERGQALAIAGNLMDMSLLPVPIVSVNIGEGGSGGALALGVADRVLMMEHAYYSVITPEGCASILWKDETKAAEAAEALGLTAGELKKRRLIDGVLKEPLGGAHREPEAAADRLRHAVDSAFRELDRLTVSELVDKRYRRLRSIGEYEEGVRVVVSDQAAAAQGNKPA